METLRRKEFVVTTKIGIILILVVAAIGIGACSISYYSDENVTITVKDKESVTVNNGEGSKNQYRIYTDKGTFVIEDTLIKGRFDSSDEYAALDAGKTYECEAFGFRIPFFSSFKNLHNCVEASR